MRFLRTEQIGGLILLGATALALIVANSPLQDATSPSRPPKVGPSSLHLHLTWAQWATDGLLTLFFVVVGLELKHEIVVGELRDPRKAMLPIFAAIGGMIAPAVVALAVGAGGRGIGKAWAVPVATDIAFALAVLALAARTLPPSLRVFLLTLAIVDDLGAIILIAVLFTAHFSILPLIGSAAAIGAYALLQRRTVPWLVAYLAAGPRRLGSPARQRHPRDPGRRGDRTRDPGHRRSRRARGAGGTARTRAATDLRRHLRTGVRVHGGRGVAVGVGAPRFRDRPRRPRGRGRPRARQDDRCLRRQSPGRTHSPGGAATGPRAGEISSR